MICGRAGKTRMHGLETRHQGIEQNTQKIALPRLVVRI